MSALTCACWSLIQTYTAATAASPITVIGTASTPRLRCGSFGFAGSGIGNSDGARLVIGLVRCAGIGRAGGPEGSMGGNCAVLSTSWPGLSRPSTSSCRREKEVVDARHKAGHDGGAG